MKHHFQLIVVFIIIFTYGSCENSDRRPDKHADEGRTHAGTPDTSFTRPHARPVAPSDTVFHGIELYHDDGSCDQNNSPWGYESGGQLAVVFSPPFYPARLIGARFFVSASGKPHTPFRVRVYEGNFADGPRGGGLLTSEVAASAASGYRWVDVDLSAQDITIGGGDFCIAMEWLVEPGNMGRNAQFLCADTSQPDRRSWWKHTPDSEWKRIERIAGKGDRDLMIRAVVSERQRGL
jgi:hypothetical protein